MDRRTSLHDYAENFLFQPESILQNENFWKQVTAENVNTKDECSATLYSWLLLAKVKWQDDPDKLDLLLQAEERFIEMGADVDLASAGSVRPIVRWVLLPFNEKELENLSKFTDTVSHFDSKWTYVQLQYLMAKLCPRISPTQMTFMKNIIIMVLAKNKKRTSMLNDMLSLLHQIFSINAIEILSNAAAADYGLKFGELENILLCPIFLKTSAELTENFLKIVLSTNISPDKCYLDFLGRFYTVSKAIIELGRKLVRIVYKTWEECLESRKLINCFLFIRDENDSLSEEFIRESYKSNWLGRKPIHLAVIFLDHLEFLPDGFIEKYIGDKDVHGCSPLHVASLHQNERAVEFILKCGHDENASDHFGLTYRNIGQVHDHEVLYDEQCRRIIEATEKTDQLLDHLKPLLVLPQAEAKRLTENLQVLFERLVKETPFSNAKIQIGGSLREKLKSGRLDEGDVQICLPDDNDEIPKKFYADRQNVKYNANWIKTIYSFDKEEKLSDALIAGLGNISWEGINLRPVNVLGPWQLIWEGNDSIKGMLLSLDVVLILFNDEEGYIEHLRQKEMLDGAPIHYGMGFIPLNSWKGKKSLCQTCFAFEWDMIDSLPPACRLAIVIAKAFVQAYHRVRGDHLHSEMPITSYLIKTALFYILAYNIGDVYVGLYFDSDYKFIDALKMMGERCGEKLKFSPNAKWITNEDLYEHGDEARVWACKIFSFIKYLGEKRIILSSYWGRDYSPHFTSIEEEVPYIDEICDCLLGKLDELKISMQKNGIRIKNITMPE